MRGNKARLGSKRPRKRSWPVTAVGLLLLLQAAGLLAIGAIHLVVAYLLHVPGMVSALVGLFSGAASSAVSSVVMGIVFVSLSVLAILAAIGFLRLRRAAWTVALLVQGSALLIALILYFREKPWYAYILMLCGIFIVLYLNTYDVRMAFRPGPVSGGREEGQQGSEQGGGER